MDTRSPSGTAQGFATVELDSTVRAACSQAFTRKFDAPAATRRQRRAGSDAPIENALAGDDGNLAAQIQRGLESLHSERMPIDVVLGPLPRQLERQRRQLSRRGPTDRPADGPRSRSCGPTPPTRSDPPARRRGRGDGGARSGPPRAARGPRGPAFRPGPAMQAAVVDRVTRAVALRA